MSFEEDARPAGWSDARLLVLSGPSGVGKDSVIEWVRSHPHEFWLSVSVTTRPRRAYEVDGEHYFFVDNAEFDRLLETGQLLEWAEFAGNRYGTPRKQVLARLAEGVPVLLKIDLQGARQVKLTMPEALLVFLAPPSWDELERRLRGRGTDDAETIAHRLEHAREELASEAEFDVTVVNDSVKQAAAELIQLLDSSSKTPVSHRRSRG
ncbi:guanylate kinase [Longispora sp. K20-0274]|uniref:guanylate kinase n=1 Tax=Longispora sp. K20-0274 TaxID=3088255 RepID=UPI003999E2E9